MVELAQVPGVPARTTRYCIAKGLLLPPLLGGRSACNGEEHPKELDRIKTLQGQGQTLAQIAWRLGAGEKPVARTPGFGVRGLSLRLRKAADLRSGGPRWLIQDFGFD